MKVKIERRFHNSSKELIAEMCEEYRLSTHGYSIENYAIQKNSKNYFTIEIEFRDIEAVIEFFHQVGARQMKTPAIPEYKELVLGIKNIREFAERSVTLTKSDKSFLVGETTELIKNIES